MEGVLNQLLWHLDSVRASTLRMTLSSATLRRLFVDRAIRLLLLTLVSLAFNLFISIYYPMGLLIFGPLIFGYPHILASIRFLDLTFKRESPRVSKLTGEKALARTSSRYFYCISTVWVGISAIRLFNNFDLIHLPLTLRVAPFFELAAMILTILLLTSAFDLTGRRGLWAAVKLAPIILAALAMPLWTNGVLILLHNFIAFPYWILATKTSREKSVAISATLLFCCISYLLMAGAFDSWHLTSDRTLLSFGHLVAPWAGRFTVQTHFVEAYAFGQAVHYFIWLKIIPDQHHQAEVPTSFRQSYALLKNYFGQSLMLPGGLALLLGGGLIWLLAELRLGQLDLFFNCLLPRLYGISRPRIAFFESSLEG